MSKDDFIELLRTRQGTSSLREFAKSLGISAAYLSDIHLKRRDPGSKIARALGYSCRKERTVTTTFTRRKLEAISLTTKEKS